MNGFLNQFPYSDFHEMNLDWILKAIKELAREMKDFEASNSIEYVGIWNISDQYSIWSVVTNGNNAYLSIKPVPSGIQVTDQNYWRFIGTFIVDTQLNQNSINPIANKPVTNKFNIVDTRLDALETGLSAETDARTSADDAISAHVNEFESELDNEVVNRMAADATINGRIDSLATLTPGSTTGDAELIDIRTEYQGVVAANAGTAVRDQVSHAMDLINNDVGVDGVSFSLTGSHSQNADLIYFPVAANEKVYCMVTTSTNESIGGIMVFKDSNGDTVTQESFRTNQLKEITVTGAAVKAGAYMPDPTNPCVVTIRLYRANALKLRIDTFDGRLINLTNSSTNNFNEIRDELKYANVNFVLTSAHSSNADRISYSVAAGKKVIIDLRTSNNNILSCSVTCKNGDTVVDQFAVTSGTPRTVTLSGDVTSFGAYVPEVEGETPVVYFSIISEDSILFNSSYDPVSVFKSNIDDALKDLISYQTFTNGINFAFISDMHWETNFKTSPILMNYIAEHSRIRTVINGGDVASGDNSDGTQQAEWLYECTSAFNGNYDYYTINGNHDNNSVGGSSTLTAAQVKNLMLPSPDSVSYGPGNYYHFAKDNTRIICLDSGAVGAADNDQIEWVKNIIENASEDYILIFSHIIFLSHSDDNPCPLFSDLMTMIGTLSAENKAKIQAIFGGHTHHDNDYVFDSIPVVVIDTDSRFPDDGITREAGTTTSQLFDLVTINYDTKTIYCKRIGTIGTDRTITY